MDDFTDLPQFRIDDLLVVPERNIVIRDGKEIKLEPRMMQVLVMLAEHSGETLSTERLLIDVWGCEVYGDNSVSKAISLMRKAIGDDSRKPRYIETVSKVGYRLIPPVSLPENYRRMPSERWTEGSPYVGLSAFDSDHASVFCGRSRVIADLLKAMRSQIDNQRRFVLIVGASGCGKTSLLRAGAIPLLTKPGGFEGLHAISVVTCDLAGNGRNPMIPLLEALAAWTVEDRPVFPPQTPEQLMLLLTETPAMIEGFVNEAFRRDPKRDLHKQPYAHLLLTVDHAEALVATNDIDLHSRDSFAQIVQALCACPHVVVTMIARGDFYHKLIEALPVLAEYKAGDGHLDVMAPRYGEIGEIIRSPAWKADLSFETHRVTRTRLDDELRDKALAQPDALPLLQHTLQTLYERRNDQRQLTFAAYDDIGGLEGAIAHQAEKVFASLPITVQTSLNSVLARLVVMQPGSEVVTARRARIDALSDDARILVEAFIRGRLFVSEMHDSGPRFGVVHEALLRQWPRATKWTTENGQLLIAKSNLKHAADLWKEQGRQNDHLLNPGRPLSEALEAAARFPEDLDEDHRRFLRASEKESLRNRWVRRGAVISLCVLVVLSTGFGVYALHARDEAKQRELESTRLNDFLLGPLAEELRKHEMLGLLGDIGTKAIDYPAYRDLDDLSSSQIANAARAYRTVGEALLKTDDTQQARKFFSRAYDLANQVLRIEPLHESAIFERGNASYWIGLLHFNEKRYENARTHWLDYRKDSERLISISPENPISQQEMSYADSNLGTLALRQGDTQSAMHYFRESISRKKSLMDEHHGNLDYQYDYIDSLSWIASTLAHEGRIRDAAREYDQHISMLEAMSNKKISANRWRSRLANYLMLSAAINIDLDEIEKSRNDATEAMRIIEQLVERFPDDQRWKLDFAKARLILAETCNLQSDRATASKLLESIASDAEKLDSKSRESITWRWIDARTRLMRAIMRTDGPAMTEADLAVTDLLRLAEEKDSDEVAESHAHALFLRGNLHSRHGNDALAKRDWRSAAAAIEKLPREGNAYRSWIWSQAMHRIDSREDVRATREWLTSIGYQRRSID